MEIRMKTIILTTLFMFMAPMAALAVDAHFDAGSGIKCTSCHNSHSTLGTTGFNNLCTSCHNNSSTKPFTQADAANPYGYSYYSSGVTPGKVYQTSHSWTGSADNERAGASSPTSAAMNNANISGKLLCVTCHSVHGGQGSVAAGTAPFLRMSNSGDSMCTDCHRTRNQSSATMGTHPVNINYSSIATQKQYTAAYRTKRISTNPSNPTAATQLVGGKIVCSTCHSIHYSDSKSSTVDSSYANPVSPVKTVWSKLSTSTGHLLKGDAWSKDAVGGVNLCQNCHNHDNHNAYIGSKSVATNLQCSDCHGGHNEYIKPGDEDDAGGKLNTKLLRRYVAYSSGTKLTDANGKPDYRRKVFYTATTSQNAIVRNGSGTGICEACHKPSAAVSEHANMSLQTTKQCYECHVGGAHPKTPPIGCTGCHGSPPERANTAGNVKYGITPSKGYAVYSTNADGTTILKSYALSSVFKNESTAGHPTHSASKPYNYLCKECHNGNFHKNTSKVGSGETYQDVFIDKAGITAGTNATFVGGTATSTCSNMFCHSYGTATMRGAKSVSWANGVRGSIVNSNNRCAACHNGSFRVGGTIYNNLSTNSHFKHVNYSSNGIRVKKFTCNVCHADTVSSNTTISNYTKHANGSRDVSFDTGVTLTASGSSWNGTTCTTYCHSDGYLANAVTVTWSSRTTGACGTCHGGTSTGATSVMASKAHLAHISSAGSRIWGPQISGTAATATQCATCHTYTTTAATSHVNGSIETTLAGGTCTTNCHRNVLAATLKSDWAASNRQECRTCHGGNLGTDPVSFDSRAVGYNNMSAPRKSMFNFSTAGHGNFKLVGDSGKMVCSDCHDPNSKHINGKRGDNRLLTALGTGNTNTECYYCHNNAAKVGTATFRGMSSHVTQRYESGVTRSSCDTCHDPHGSTNIKMIRVTFSVLTGNGLGATTKTVSYTDGTAGFVNNSRTGICQVCHTRTKFYRNYTSRTGVYTVSGTGTYLGSFDKHQSNNRNCLSCHPHISSKYAFFPATGACDGCHGYPPRTGDGKTNPVASSDVHGKHNMTAKTISDGMSGSASGLACSACHSGHAISPVSNSIAVPNHLFNSGSSFTYTSNTCSNVSCHFKASPAWK